MSAALDPLGETLDLATREAVGAEVDKAKRRGWDQAALKRYFSDRGLSLSDYKAGVGGGAIPSAARSFLAQISITGLPRLPFEPNAAEVRTHLDWLTASARGPYDDALVEIAHGAPDAGITRARLFGLDELDAAVAFAVQQNLDGHNVYVGAALRLPDADRGRRASDEDFYLSTAVPIDIDQDYDATRARMASVCEDGLVVTTGLTPERRSQHWVRLVEPCDDVAEFAGAFAALVSHTGADQAVKDAARVMRLGGTVSFPSARKVAKGYSVELTSVVINVQARPSSVEALCQLAPNGEMGARDRRDFSGRAPNAAIERDWTGRVLNGRELHWRDLIIRAIREFQETNGADPTADDVWATSWPMFSDPARVDNTDARWTSPEGQQALQQRVRNVERRATGTPLRGDRRLKGTPHSDWFRHGRFGSARRSSSGCWWWRQWFGFAGSSRRASRSRRYLGI